MSTSLSRRGLFRALSPKEEQTAPEPPLAQASQGCLELKSVSCRRCAEVCDVDAIRFVPLGRGRARMAVAFETCVGCADCVAVCPVSAITMVARDRAALAAGLAAAALDQGASA